MRFFVISGIIKVEVSVIRKNGEWELPLFVFPSSGGGCGYTRLTNL